MAGSSCFKRRPSWETKWHAKYLYTPKEALLAAFPLLAGKCEESPPAVPRKPRESLLYLHDLGRLAFVCTVGVSCHLLGLCLDPSSSSGQDRHHAWDVVCRNPSLHPRCHNCEFSNTEPNPSTLPQTCLLFCSQQILMLQKICPEYARP